jgi:hypothetical protein
MLVKKIAKYFVRLMVGVVAISLLLTYLLLNSVWFQNWLARKATTYLNSTYNTNISIERIRFSPFRSFSLQNILFADPKMDTLFFVQQLDFKIKELSPEALRFGLAKVRLTGSYCKLTTYADSVYSLDAINGFMSGDTTVNPNDTVPFHLYFNDLKMVKGHFRLYDFLSEIDSTAFDGLHEDFSEIAIELKTFHIVDDSLYLDINHFSTKERSGFVLSDMQAKAVISPRGMYFDSLHIKTPYSEIGNYVSMQYNSWDHLAEDFINNVKMKVLVKNTKIDMRDFAFFAPELSYLNIAVNTTGEMRGTISNMRLKNIDVSFGEGTKFKGDITMQGIPDIYNTFIDSRIEYLKTNAADIALLTDMGMPEEVFKLGNIQYKGAITGFISDFVSYGKFQTDAGEVSSDINLKMAENTEPEYSGTINAKDFKLGQVLGLEKYIGAISFGLKVNGKGFDIEKLNNRFDLKVSTFDVYQHLYKDIAAKGEINNKSFKGNLDIKDIALDLGIAAQIDFNKPIPEYDLKGEVRYMNLKQLKLDTNELAVMGLIDVDFNYQDLDHNEGTILLTDLLFVKNGKDYDIEKIAFSTVNNANNRIMRLSADEFEATVNGTIKFMELKEIGYDVLAANFPAYFSPKKHDSKGQSNFKLKLITGNLDVYTQLFFPYFEIESLSFELNYKDINEAVVWDIQQKCAYIRYDEYEIMNTSINSSTEAQGQEISFHFDKLELEDSSVINNAGFHALAGNNNIKTQISIADSLANIFTSMNIATDFYENTIETKFDTSAVYFRKIRIAFNDAGTVIYNGQQIKFDDFAIQVDRNQHLFLNGYSDFEGHSNIRVDITNIDLNVVNSIYRKLDFKLDGLLNGALVWKATDQSYTVETFLKVNRLAFDNDTIGDFTINSNFNEKQNRLLVYLKSIEGKLKSLEAGGFVSFASSDFPIDFSVSFAESRLDAFQAFLKSNATIYNGTAIMNGKITGAIKKPVINGNIQLNNVEARVEYLQTIYRFSSEIKFDESSITLVPTKIKDEKNSEALLKGSMTHSYFSNFYTDFSLSQMNNFKVLNTVEKDNELFYGKAFATGSITLKGSFDDLVVDARLRTENNTILYLPTYSSSSSDAAYINYVSKDTMPIKVNSFNKNSLSGFAISMLVDVTPNAEVQLLLDPKTDDKVVGSGKGVLKMEMNKQGDFTMFGTVNIDKGEYKLTAANVFTRKFIINKGSSLTWNGDPLAAIVDISAIYKVRRTSIVDIVNTATEEERKQLATQKIPVECILMIKGNFLTPDIKFDLNFPDMQGIVGTNNVSMLENSLRTLRSNPEMMNEQVISLLIFGKFMPIAGLQQMNTEGNLSSGINNTVSDLISAQANNLVGKIVPGLDFNVDIQTNMQTQQASYVVSASKKWFDERLEVQGSYDPSNFNNNFMTQYDLNKSGNTKFKVFSKSTNDALYNKNVTTQGLGLYFRKEFDHFSELLRKKNY